MMDVTVNLTNFIRKTRLVSIGFNVTSRRCYNMKMDSPCTLTILEV